MKLRFLGKDRAVGLDLGNGSVKALVLERRRSEVVVVGRGVGPLEEGADISEAGRAVQTALGQAGAAGEPVIAAVGGPEVVIRQLTLPPVPRAKVLPALELQHR